MGLNVLKTDVLLYYFSFSDLKPKISESKDIVELSKHFFMVNLEVRVLAFKEKKNKLIEISSFNKHWGKVKDSHGTLTNNYIGDVFFRTMKYQKMENMTLMDHMFQELFSSVILTFCNFPAIAILFPLKIFFFFPPYVRLNCIKQIPMAS